MWRARLGQCTEPEGGRPEARGQAGLGQTSGGPRRVRIPRELSISRSLCRVLGTEHEETLEVPSLHLSADHRAPAARRAATGLLLFPPHSRNSAQPRAGGNGGERHLPLSPGSHEHGQCSLCPGTHQRGPRCPAPASAITVPFRLLGSPGTPDAPARSRPCAQPVTDRWHLGNQSVQPGP